MVSIKWIHLRIIHVGISLSSLVSDFSFAANSPSLCGIAVYNDDTSAVTRRLFFGAGLIVDSLFRKSVVSWRYEGMSLMSGLSISSTISEILAVGASMADTMGLPGFPGLCIFGSM